MYRLSQVTALMCREANYTVKEGGLKLPPQHTGPQHTSPQQTGPQPTGPQPKDPQLNEPQLLTLTVPH